MLGQKQGFPGRIIRGRAESNLTQDCGMAPLHYSPGKPHYQVTENGQLDRGHNNNCEQDLC